MIINFEVSNCTECPEHKVLSDPDPYDWFCDDDVKVVCKAKNDKVITCGCRPHHTKKECNVPSWCPRKPKIKKENIDSDVCNEKDKNKERLDAVRDNNA